MSVENTRGTTALIWLDSNPADPAAPTAAELGAGTRLDPYMVADSLTRSLEGQMIPLNRQHTRFNGQIAGNHGGQPVSAQFERNTDAAGDVAWELFTFGQEGALVATDTGFTGASTSVNGGSINAPAAGDRCEVWPSAEVNGFSPGAAGYAIVTLQWAMKDEPELHAVVAA